VLILCCTGTGQGCIITFRDRCESIDGDFWGDDTDCAVAACPVVPVASRSGWVVMTVLILLAATRRARTRRLTA
jgi:hypothetical protein